MTLRDLYDKIEFISRTVNTIDIPLKHDGKDFDIDLDIVDGEGCKVSHIEVRYK